MIRVAIVEDEKASFLQMQEALDRYQKETGILFSVSRFRNSEMLLTGYRPVYDVIFMDIDLPGINGMEAAKMLRENDEKVSLIFVTAFPQFALQGYRVSATDYFCKPVPYCDLKMRLNRIAHEKKTGEQSVCIPVKNGTRRVSAGRIYYIETTGHILNYHTADTSFCFLALDYGMFGDKKEIRDRMSTLLKELRESPRAEGCERIYTHGEKEWESMERKKREGIPVQEKTLSELRDIASSLSIDANRYLDIQS